MKRFFWLLILINLGLLAYFNIGHILPGKPEIKLTEINPDKIKLLSQSEIDALPKKTSPPPAIVEPQPVAMCFEWGIFSDANLATAQKALAKMAIQATAKEENSNQPKRYWVYKPPVKTTAEAQKRAAEFKELGVEDLFVVQEEKWKNAISFGIFEDEQLAEKLVQELRAKGIKNVEKVLRTNGKGHHSLLLGSLNENEIAELKKLKPDFPAAELKEVSCNG
jgi:cell division septation protein DedD